MNKIYKRKSKYTKELLEEIIKKSISYAAVLRALGLKMTGGNYQNIKQRISNYDIDISHFHLQGWSKGLTSETNESIRKNKIKISYTDEEILKENSPESKGPRLKNLMIKYGQQYKCVNGHDPIWMNISLTLHVDHIDGNRSNNNLNNLRFLCPNCHQQTKTWGNNRGHKNRFGVPGQI